MLGPDTFRFYHGIGINLKQVLGLTEAGNPAFHEDGHLRFDSLGRPVPEAGLKISAKGEILIKKESCFTGYHKDPERTKEVFEDGYYKTGDAGYISEDGQLIYIDRLKDLIQLGQGRKFSPQYVESRARFSQYIKDAIVLGGKDRSFVSAIIDLDRESVGHWAERKSIAFTNFAELSQMEPLRKVIRTELHKVNRNLPEYSRIRRFANMYKEFDADDSEVTRTHKLRRDFMEKKYADLISAIYEGKESVEVRTEVVYQDGKRGTISTVVHITPLDD